MTKEIVIDKLIVQIYDTPTLLGAEASRRVGDKLRFLLMSQAVVNVIFAAAPSQNEFLAQLIVEKGIDWSRVNAFQVDEYIGLNKNHPQTFGNFLKSRLFDKIQFRNVYTLDGNADDPEEECNRYSTLLTQFHIDIVCLGIGENNHIAFNDPYVADFNDPNMVKVVDLDDGCRRQQINDGCFSQIDQVPTSALTLTVPALLKAKFIYCIVPGENKAEAIYNTLNKEISRRYPSTILRTHQNAILFIDTQSAAKLDTAVF